MIKLNTIIKKLFINILIFFFVLLIIFSIVNNNNSYREGFGVNDIDKVIKQIEDAIKFTKEIPNQINSIDRKFLGKFNDLAGQLNSSVQNLGKTIEQNATGKLNQVAGEIDNKVLGKFNDLTNQLNNNLQNMGQTIEKNATGKLNQIGNEIDNKVLGKFNDLVSQLTNNLQNLGKIIEKNALDKLNSLGGEIQNNAFNKINSLGNELEKNTVGKLTKLGSEIENNTIGKLTKIGEEIEKNTVDKITKLGKQIEKNAVDKIEKLGNEIEKNTVDFFTKKLKSIFTQLGDMFNDGLIKPINDLFVGLGNIFVQIFGILEEIGNKIVQLPGCVLTYAIKSTFDTIEFTYTKIIPKVIRTPLSFLYKYTLGIIVDFIANISGFNDSVRKCYGFNVKSEIKKINSNVKDIDRSFKDNFGNINFSKIKI